MNVVEPAQTKCISLAVHTPKEEGTISVYFEYQKLNSGRVCDLIPSTRLVRFIGTLARAKVLSTIDRNSDYRKIKAAESEKTKT